MKVSKIIALILAALIALACCPALATTFTSSDEHTKEYATDAFGELELTAEDFTPEAFAETVYAICEQHYWQNDGSYVAKVDYSNGALAVDIVAPTETIAPLPEKAYYLSVVSQITSTLLQNASADPLWSSIVFTFTGNGDPVVVTLMQSDSLGSGSDRVTDDSVILSQIR